MQVAKANEIKYAPTECHHEGDCAGTCPSCEAEVRYLEQQLQLRRQLGKAVAVVGVSMGLVALASCGSKATDQTAGEIPIEMFPDTLRDTSQPIDPKMAATDSITDTLSIESQTDGFLDMDSDTLSVASQVVETNNSKDN